MTDERRFARLASDPAGGPGTIGLPNDGMCLSVYLLLHPPRKPRQVLLGRLDPGGPWIRAAALGPERVARIGDRWVLPATQLLLFEGPDEAARRIATELLGRPDLRLAGPRVFSEAYARPGGPSDPHWDLQFVYDGEWPAGSPPPERGNLWRELQFVDVARTPTGAFGRAHGDVLALAGLPPRSEA